jgi:hypothetical protein
MSKLVSDSTLKTRFNGLAYFIMGLTLMNISGLIACTSEFYSKNPDYLVPSNNVTGDTIFTVSNWVTDAISIYLHVKSLLTVMGNSSVKNKLYILSASTFLIVGVDVWHTVSIYTYDVLNTVVSSAFMTAISPVMIILGEFIVIRLGPSRKAFATSSNKAKPPSTLVPSTRKVSASE